MKVRGHPVASEGLSLVEVVVSIAIATILLGAVIPLARSVTRASDTNLAAQLVGPELASAGEQLRALAYVDCARPRSYRLESDGPVTVTVESVEYWNQARERYERTCPTVDGGGQLVTLTAEAGPDIPETSASFVVRRGTS